MLLQAIMRISCFFSQHVGLPFVPRKELILVFTFSKYFSVNVFAISQRDRDINSERKIPYPLNYAIDNIITKNIINAK